MLIKFYSREKSSMVPVADQRCAVSFVYSEQWKITRRNTLEAESPQFYCAAPRRRNALRGEKRFLIKIILY